MDFIHVTVAAIIRRNDQYLLVKEYASSGHLVYNQPAGHVELNESVQDAVIREVLEETGLTFTPTALTGTYLLSPATNGKTYLRFCFVGDVPKDQLPAPQDDDIVETCWLTKAEISSLPYQELRSALVLECLKDYLKGVRIPLETLNFSSNEYNLAEECLRHLNKKTLS